MAEGAPAPSPSEQRAPTTRPPGARGAPLGPPCSSRTPAPRTHSWTLVLKEACQPCQYNNTLHSISSSVCHVVFLFIFYVGGSLLLTAAHDFKPRSPKRSVIGHKRPKHVGAEPFLKLIKHILPSYLHRLGWKLSMRGSNVKSSVHTTVTTEAPNALPPIASAGEGASPCWVGVPLYDGIYYLNVNMLQQRSWNRLCTRSSKKRNVSTLREKSKYSCQSKLRPIMDASSMILNRLATKLSEELLATRLARCDMGLTRWEAPTNVSGSVFTYSPTLLHTQKKNISISSNKAREN